MTEIQTQTLNLVHDTGVISIRNGYLRTTLWTGWDPSSRTRPAVVTLEVRQHRADSSLTIAVWGLAGGWHRALDIPTSDWWSKVPGYLRADGDKTEAESFKWSQAAAETFAKIVSEDVTF